MKVPSIITVALPLLLGGALVTACNRDQNNSVETDGLPADERSDAKLAELKPPVVELDEHKVLDVPKPTAVVSEGGSDESGAVPVAGDETAGDIPSAPPNEPSPSKETNTKKPSKPKTPSKPEKPSEPAKPTPPEDPKGDPPTLRPKLDGKQLYVRKCKSCHGASGQGDTKLGERHNIADWTKPGWKAKWSVARIENIVTNGKPDTKMNSFKKKLTEEEITAVSRYSWSIAK